MIFTLLILFTILLNFIWYKIGYNKGKLDEAIRQLHEVSKSHANINQYVGDKMGSVGVGTALGCYGSFENKAKGQ